jgi:hypothetical protein
VTIADLAEIEEKEEREFILITDSQDIETYLKDIGKAEEINEYGLLFVELIDGEINKMYGHFQNVAYNHYELDELV